MMDQNYEMALSEVDEILNYTDEELVKKKIPIQLRILISNNKKIKNINQILIELGQLVNKNY